MYEDVEESYMHVVYEQIEKNWITDESETPFTPAHTMRIVSGLLYPDSILSSG